MCSCMGHIKGGQKALWDLCLQPSTDFTGWGLKITIVFKKSQQKTHTRHSSCVSCEPEVHGTIMLLPQLAWAHLGEGLPCTEWYRVYFRGLNSASSSALCPAYRNSWRGTEEQGRRFPQDGLLFVLITWRAPEKYLSFKCHHCKVKLPFVAPRKSSSSYSVHSSYGR